MSSTVIEISELRKRYEGKVKALAEFLRDRLGVKTEVSDRGLTMKSERTISKDYLRVLLRKFLHKEDLKEEFRVISGSEGTLVIKERKIIQAE